MIERGSGALRQVVAEFARTTLPTRTVDRLERIENGPQHELFSVCRRNMARELGPDADKAGTVRLLFHGTSEAAVHAIINSDTAGFLPLLAGTCRGAVWGNGTYFARDASYSDDYAAVLSSGQRQMLAVEVAVGRWTRGAPGLKACPMLPGESCRRYNSLVDDEQRPSIFVIQHAMQAYPAYLITYR